HRWVNRRCDPRTQGALQLRPRTVPAGSARCRRPASRLAGACRSAAPLSLSLGRFLLGRVLLLALFTLVGLHGRARIAVLRRLFPAAAAPVVGRVEARSLVVDSDRMQAHLDGALA